MNLKASVGICRKTDNNEDKLVILPKDPEMFDNNEFVVIIGADEFLNFADGINGIIKFMESVKEGSNMNLKNMDAEAPKKTSFITFIDL
ncbi:MAG: hypothetical protein K8E24_000895 [Methanobacterium paludis]|nr:hypothetical protein [Methanobacterium paludis]